MAVRDVLKFIKFSIPFLVSYGLKRLAQSIGALLHAFSYKPGPSPKNVVIIGGSFAGISLARKLCGSLPSGYRVILVEKNTHFHYPFVFPRYSVVKRHETKAFIPYDEILCSGRSGVPEGIFERRCGTVTEVTKTSVKLASGEAIGFEFLAIATGTSSPRPSKLASLDKHGACVELRMFQEQIGNARSIAVVGGGAVGVELVTDIKGWYPEKDVTMVHSRDRLLHAYGPRLHDRAMEEMEKLGITVKLGQRPRIQLDDDEKTGKNAILAFPNGHVDKFDLVVSSLHVKFGHS
jgi:apoptosis-inducing factor 2